MITAQQVKDYARACGADLVGIGSLDRFDGAPAHMDPRYIFPEATVIIGFAFRIPRGYLRGIEEGTHFYQYPALGYASINEVYAPSVLREVACMLEDEGYEGVAIRNIGCNSIVSDITGDPNEPATYGRRLRYSRPVREGQPPPDVYLHFRIAAFICGLGEIGHSKLFLTPEYGPRQRFAFMLTDAPLQPDPLYEGPELCDHCMACVADCPPHAISADQRVQITVAGRPVQWGKLAEWQCFWGYASGVGNANPFIPPDVYADLPQGDEIFAGNACLSPEQVQEVHRRVSQFYPRPGGYIATTCGGRGCIRACMVHLEERGVLKQRFRTPFRKRRPWWR
jgi:epoxyqueuosine reductase